MGKTLLVVLTLLSQIAVGKEALIAVDRMGPTRSLQYHYLEKSQPKIPNQDGPKRLSEREWYEKILPINTSMMSPGVVYSESRNFGRLLHPVFIIGSDDRSIAWLEHNRDELIDIGAVGMLVQVTTIDELERVLKLAQGLRLAPGSGDRIAELLRLDHYPILLSRNGFEQ